MTRPVSGDPLVLVRIISSRKSVFSATCGGPPSFNSTEGAPTVVVTHSLACRPPPAVTSAQLLNVPRESARSTSSMPRVSRPAIRPSFHCSFVPLASAAGLLLA